MFEFIRRKKGKIRIGLFDCKDASITETDVLPAKIGGGASCALKIEADGDLFEIKKDGDCFLINPLNAENVLINSCLLEKPLKVDGLSTLQVGDRLFYLLFADADFEKAAAADLRRWLVFYALTGRVEDELPFARIKQTVARRGITGEGVAICPKGFDRGFFFNDVFAMGEKSRGGEISPVLPDTVATVTCPLCWLKFDVGDAMNIATAESLRSDPVLGAEEMLRFLPTSFTFDGIAIDPEGLPAPDLACPHCRKKLPAGFFDLDNKIFSIVGAPSSGKSYYLSVLIKELQNALYKNFKITLKDLDPSGNMLLTQMRNKLFSAEKPEDAILAKTALEGSMYERYPRFGKMVALPKPMTYSLSAPHAQDKDTSLIFYDNAGEHFEPGLDLEESPGAMHVASSAAIFFLFDPAANRNFKRLLPNHPDPQLTIGGRLDQQDTILSEMEIRVKRILSINMSKKISTPLAVIIGKCDIWMPLLKTTLKPAISKEGLDIEAIDFNSRALEDFLADIDPSIVSAAKSISSDVRFFALSALGHSPIMIKEGPYAGKIAPVPSLLNPINVEIPTLWALSRVSKVIPVK